MNMRKTLQDVISQMHPGLDPPLPEPNPSPLLPKYRDTSKQVTNAMAFTDMITSSGRSEAGVQSQSACLTPNNEHPNALDPDPNYYAFKNFRIEDFALFPMTRTAMQIKELDGKRRFKTLDIKKPERAERQTSRPKNQGPTILRMKNVSPSLEGKAVATSTELSMQERHGGS